jgi:hypothetical protein
LEFAGCSVAGRMGIWGNMGIKGVCHGHDDPASLTALVQSPDAHRCFFNLAVSARFRTLCPIMASV